MRCELALYEILMGFKMIRQSRTPAIARARWQLLRTALQSIITDPHARAEFIVYFEKCWMTDSWMPAWVDFGRIMQRILSRVTTSNSVERLWVDVIRHV